jgi:transcriptional regulator GlxA family with amidase domain
MLCAPDAQGLNVAVACGFKTQHFAQVFRDVCRVSPQSIARILSAPKRLARRKPAPKISHAW